MYLCDLSFGDRKYAKLKGLSVLPPRREEGTEDQKQWMLNISQLLVEGPADIAIELAKESFRKFHEVPYEEFVRKACGFPLEPIDEFLWYYELLAHKIYAKFIRVSLNPLPQVKEVSRRRLTDPSLPSPKQI